MFTFVTFDACDSGENRLLREAQRGLMWPVAVAGRGVAVILR